MHPSKKEAVDIQSLEITFLCGGMGTMMCFFKCC